jgi:signal transduction histidine kinase
MQLLDGFSTLLRRDAKSTHTARKLIDAARRFNLLRLRHHRIRLECPLLEKDGQGFEAKFAFGLVIGALNNLIDNALYWMRVRWPDTPPDGEPSPRRLFINVSDEFEAGPAIIVADTGVGFQGDEPDRLVRPFFTRKPTGMGLGLYYSNLAMELNGGFLAFPQPDEVSVPPEYDGAIVAMVFGKSS